MTLKIVIIACVASVVLADIAPIYAPPPPHHPPPNHPHPPPPPPHHPHPPPPPPHHPHPPPPPAHHPHPPPAPQYAAHVDYPDIPPNYEYKYGVADAYSLNNFVVSEKRNGDNTEGQYTVDLPDGRTQIFSYVDKGDGLVADVKYEGEAKHPVHSPAPTYSPPSPSPPSMYA